MNLSHSSSTSDGRCSNALSRGDNLHADSRSVRACRAQSLLPPSRPAWRRAHNGAGRVLASLPIYFNRHCRSKESIEQTPSKRRTTRSDESHLASYLINPAMRRRARAYTAFRAASSAGLATHVWTLNSNLLITSEFRKHSFTAVGITEAEKTNDTKGH